MQKNCYKAVCALLLSLSLGAYSDISMARLGDNMGFERASRAGSWRFTEDPQYNYAKYSASHLLSLREAIPHHSLSINIQDNLVDSYSFRVGCMLQTVTPMFELKVPTLAVRMFDTLNNIVYARFIIDDNQEFSLRGELLGRNRIVFAPVTKSQERGIADLFEQMRKGKELKIGLLQGANTPVRLFDIPLQGFEVYADDLYESCVKFNSHYSGELKYLPDYMAKEPEGYAPKDFSLKPKEEKSTTTQQVMPQMPQVQEAPQEQAAEPIPVQKPDVLPFSPDGSPASIGPDGMPIGADGSAYQARSGQPVEQAIGKVNSTPMQIGPDGAPIQSNQNTGGFEPQPQDAGSVDIF